MRFDRISGEFTGSVVNALVVTIPPQHKSSPVMHPGEELVYVLGGNLRFTLGGRKVLMEQGDSVHLPSTTPHAWENPFTEEATVLWVGTAPLFQHDADLHAAGEDLLHHGSPTGIPLAQAIAKRRAQHA
jgi:quercetin dioxygenase-like cupin family protein